MLRPPEDRRVAPRFPVQVELRLLAPEQHMLLLSHTMDLSVHGALVRANREIPVGTQVRVSLFREEMLSPLQLDAEVVRLAAAAGAQRHPGIGLRFAQLSEVDRTTLIGMIERRGHAVLEERH